MKEMLLKTGLFWAQTTIAVQVICILLIGAVTNCTAHDFAKLDEAVPRGYVTTDFAPAFDFDGDGCYPSCGISRSGVQNGGLGVEWFGSKTAGCDSSNFLNTSNTLHRYAAITSGGSTYSAHFYALYFEKDQTDFPVPFFYNELYGHRHDWEYVAIWTKDGQITHVGTSAHGGLYTNTAFGVLYQGTHPKIVYHQEDPATHALRFAGSIDDVAENPYRAWVTPTITSWYELTGDDDISNQEMRGKLNTFDYKDCCNENDKPYGASIPLKDGAFLTNLNKWKPDSYPIFTEQSIWASNPNNPVLSRVDGDGSLFEEGSDYVLDFGAVPSGAQRYAELAVKNDVSEEADTLDGIFDISGATPFVLTGFDDFSGLDWEQSRPGLGVEINTEGLGLGVATRMVEFTPIGQIDDGNRVPWRDPITLTLRLQVVAALPGDYNYDGRVDAADYVVWRKAGINGQQGYDDWRSHFGQTAGTGSGASVNAAIPEAASIVLLIMGALAMWFCRRPAAVP